MNNQSLRKLSEQELESALSLSLSDKTPVEEITNSITPWKKSMTMAILGLAFSTLTPAIFYLDYILPVIGITLSLCGFRKLRRENKEFFICYIMSIIKVVTLVFSLFMRSTIYGSGDYGTAIGNINLGISLSCSFITFILLASAIRKAQMKANLPVKIKGAVTMIVLYAVMLIWAILQLEIPLLMYGVIALYIGVFINLNRILNEIDTAGYAIESAPVKICDGLLALILVLISVLCMVCGYLFFHSYDMQWKEFSQNEHSSVAEIKQDLLTKGFPGNVLNDMSTEDITACKDAVKVYWETEEYSVDESVEVLELEFNPDDPEIKDIRLTHVIILLDEERRKWMYLNYFEWLRGDDFYGTEAIQIWTEHGSNWVDYNSFNGRVLYDENGRTYSSPYFSFDNESYINDHPILGGAKSDVFAKFSFPPGDLNQRGYVCYIGDEKWEGHTGMWINYNHQKTFFQYPVKSAAKSRQTDSTVSNGAFILIMDAYSFFTDTEEFK